MAAGGRKKRRLIPGRWYAILFLDHASHAASDASRPQEDTFAVVVGRFLRTKGAYLEFGNFIGTAHDDHDADVWSILRHGCILKIEEVEMPEWAYKT